MKIVMAVAATLAGSLLAGCGGGGGGGEQPTDAPKQRVLIESQVRLFTDRVLAELRNSPNPVTRALAESPDENVFGGKPYRSAIEEDGRAVCSHMIGGVPVNQAYASAFPKAPGVDDFTYRQRAADSQRKVELAAELLCPAR